MSDSTERTATVVAAVAAILPTLDEAISRFGSSETLDGRDAKRLIEWLPSTRWHELGLEIEPKTNPEVLAYHNDNLQEWNAETVALQLANDVAFGFEKALDQRGLSAGAMYAVIEMWLRIFGIRKEFTEEYAQYGLPLFREVAIRFGLPNPIGDDTGDENKYSCDYDPLFDP